MPLPKFPIVPDQSDYVYDNPIDILEADVDGGLPRRRRDIAGAPALVSVSWRFNLEEYQYFRAFYNTQLNKGLGQFLIDLILDQPELQEFTARFKIDGLSMTEPVGLNMLVTAKLEVVPIDNTAIDEVVLELYGVSGYFESLEQLVNVDWILP